MVERKSLAFRNEFYGKAHESQIRDDLVSYLGEYRFEISEHTYRMGIISGILTDPNTDEPMSLKVKKAIEIKRRDGLNISREEAELAGFVNLEKGLSQKPFGTVVWFSPPGPKEEGYGDYGFAFVGRRNGSELEMTAIRLENPKINDFNEATSALWGEKGYKKAEDLLTQPKVIDISLEKVKEFIRGNFEIKDSRNKNVFKKALDKLDGIIEEAAQIIKNGTLEQKQKAFYTVENLAIEFRERLDHLFKENVVFMSDYRMPKLSTFMEIGKYTNQPRPVAGSCGSTRSSNTFKSNNIFNSFSSLNSAFSEEKEWFVCPICGYKADGPIGNTCPKDKGGCGLTKEKFAEESGEKICV